jgi:hypothetical protein
LEIQLPLTHPASSVKSHQKIKNWKVGKIGKLVDAAQMWVASNFVKSSKFVVRKVPQGESRKPEWSSTRGLLRMSEIEGSCREEKAKIGVRPPSRPLPDQVTKIVSPNRKMGVGGVEVPRRRKSMLASDDME